MPVVLIDDTNINMLYTMPKQNHYVSTSFAADTWVVPNLAVHYDQGHFSCLIPCGYNNFNKMYKDLLTQDPDFSLDGNSV